MRRSSSIRVPSLFEAAAWLAGTLTACLSGESIDLGTNYDARTPQPDGAPADAAESGADGPRDAPGDRDTGAPDAPSHGQDADAPAPPAAICILSPSLQTT